MKRAVVTGVVAFLLGAATAPKAANQNETMVLLCKRWQEWGGATYRDSTWKERDAAISFMGKVVCDK